MRYLLIGAAILFAGPAHAGDLIQNGDFIASQNAGVLDGNRSSTYSAAADWKLYNNTVATTYSELVADFGGRSNVLHIVTSGADNGAYQEFLGGALTGYADIYVVNGRVRFGAYTNGGMTAVGSSLTTGIGSFERVTFSTLSPFNLVALYSYGGGAEYYIDVASASDSVSFGAATAAVPEPATWALMLVGFGAVGSALRRRQKVTGCVRFA